MRDCSPNPLVKLLHFHHLGRFIPTFKIGRCLSLFWVFFFFLWDCCALLGVYQSATMRDWSPNPQLVKLLHFHFLRGLHPPSNGYYLGAFFWAFFWGCWALTGGCIYAIMEDCSPNPLAFTKLSLLPRFVPVFKWAWPGSLFSALFWDCWALLLDALCEWVSKYICKDEETEPRLRSTDAWILPGVRTQGLNRLVLPATGACNVGSLDFLYRAVTWRNHLPAAAWALSMILHTTHIWFLPDNISLPINKLPLSPSTFIVSASAGL